MDFALSFSEYITITSSEEALKMCEHNFFQEIKRKVVLLVIYLFNYDSSKSTFFMLNMAFDVLVLTFWVQFLLYKLEFFVSCNIITRTSFFCSVFWSKFFQKIIVLHHGDNNFLFYFDICIKFTLSTIISTMKNW